MASETASAPEPDNDLVYGGVCPVCGDEFTDGFERLQELEGESLEGVRICVIDPPEENLFHLPEDQTSKPELDFEEVSVETLKEAAWELQETGCYLGWSDSEKEAEYRTIAAELLESAESGGTDKPMPASRLAAELGHFSHVRRAEVQFENRILVKVTDEGMCRTDLNTVREFGWKVSGFTIGSNTVSIVRDETAPTTGGGE